MNTWESWASSARASGRSAGMSSAIDIDFVFACFSNIVIARFAMSDTLDGKNVLRRYVLKEGVFNMISSQNFGKKTAAFWVEGKTLWSIEKAGELSGRYELKRYSLKLYDLGFKELDIFRD